MTRRRRRARNRSTAKANATTDTKAIAAELDAAGLDQGDRIQRRHFRPGGLLRLVFDGRLAAVLRGGRLPVGLRRRGGPRRLGRGRAAAADWKSAGSRDVPITIAIDMASQRSKRRKPGSVNIIASPPRIKRS